MREMTDKEFDDLKVCIETAYDKYIELQNLYKSQTGVNWVKPVRLFRYFDSQPDNVTTI